MWMGPFCNSFSKEKKPNQLINNTQPEKNSVDEAAKSKDASISTVLSNIGVRDMSYELQLKRFWACLQWKRVGIRKRAVNEYCSIR